MYAPMLRPVTHPTRIAVVGCGYWGMNYVRVFSELPDAEVMACDEQTSRLDDVARRLPVVALATDVAELLERDDLDGVIVCTPASTHRAIAGAALEAGKHVLVEKPLTTNTGDAEELIALAHRRDRVLLT